MSTLCLQEERTLRVRLSVRPSTLLGWPESAGKMSQFALYPGTTSGSENRRYGVGSSVAAGLGRAGSLKSEKVMPASIGQQFH